MSKILKEQFEIIRKKIIKKVAFLEEKKGYVEESKFEKTLDEIRDLNDALLELAKFDQYNDLDKNKYKIVIIPKKGF